MEVGWHENLVLIETLWNVKQPARNTTAARTSFNRNIVECKVLPAFSAADTALGFNRNIVECKGARTDSTGTVRQGF